MGIVETELASFELSEFDSCRVEYNANGDIHLHLDQLRIELSPAEFDHFVTVVQQAHDELIELKSGAGAGDRDR
jgi:hypothetical protein